MQRAFTFSKNKFEKLSNIEQHKKCAELLVACCSSDHADTRKHLLSTYQQWQQWMDNDGGASLSSKDLSDRLHRHLKQSGQHLREDKFLSFVRRGDNSQPTATSLQVTVYLDNLRSAHNVGSIIRSTEAFQLGTVAFSKDTPFTDCRKVQKAAMGTEHWCPCKQITTIDTLPKPIIALETSGAATALDNVTFPQQPFCLAVGNEEYGCSDDILDSAELIVEIPLCGRKNSLNVANAFAITAAAIRRQHQLQEQL